MDITNNIFCLLLPKATDNKAYKRLPTTIGPTNNKPGIPTLSHIDLALTYRWIFGYLCLYFLITNWKNVKWRFILFFAWLKKYWLFSLNPKYTNTGKINVSNNEKDALSLPIPYPINSLFSLHPLQQHY